MFMPFNESHYQKDDQNGRACRGQQAERMLFSCHSLCVSNREPVGRKYIVDYQPEGHCSDHDRCQIDNSRFASHLS